MTYRVIFEVFLQGEGLFNKSVEEKTIEVTANNAKMATLKAMAAINKIEGYDGLWKNVKCVEVMEDGEQGSAV